MPYIFSSASDMVSNYKVGNEIQFSTETMAGSGQRMRMTSLAKLSITLGLSTALPT